MNVPKPLKWWWFAVSLHFFGAYHCYFSLIAGTGNRMTLLWQNSHLLFLAAALGLSALAATFSALILSRFCKDKNFRQVALLYILIVAWSLFGQIGSLTTNPFLEEFVKLLLFGLFSVAIIKTPERLSSLCLTGFLILSPTLPIFFLNASRYPSYSLSSGSLPMETTPASKENVYVFLFDEWAYERLFRDGKLDPAMTALADVARHSIILHRAFSPRTITLESVPRTLTLKRLGIINHDYLAQGKNMATVLSPNVFSLARDSGFDSYAVGYYIPYTDWFGKHLTYSRTASGRQFKNPLARLAYFSVQISADNLIFRIPAIWGFVFGGLSRTVSRARLTEVHAGTLQVLNVKNKNAFGFFHYPIPHDAFLARRDELKRRSPKEAIAYYHDLLLEVDQRVAENVARLKTAGVWDDSLIIFTSDHGWRDDPKPRNKDTHRCHIPMFIKLPHQKKRIDSFIGFDSRRLRNILRTAFSHEPLLQDPEIQRLLSPGKESLTNCERLPYPKY